MDIQKGKEMLSKKEVAAYLGVSVSTIDRKMKSKEIPYHKLGRTVRFSKKEIEEYLERTKEA